MLRSATNTNNVNPAQFIYRSVGTVGVTDQTLAIRAFITRAGVNAQLIFNPAEQHIISGRLVPLDGQSIFFLHYKRADQVFTTTTASLADGASSIAVTDITGFTLGMSITVQTVAETLIGTATRGEPVNFTVYPCDIDLITPDTPNAVTGPGTLHVNYPFGIVGGPLVSGAIVATSYPIIGNRREVDLATTAAGAATPYNQLDLVYCNGDGNYLLQKYSGWRTMSEFDLISNKMTIWECVKRNFPGEGWVFGGADTLVERPDSDGGIGNNIHFSAYTSKGGQGGRGTGENRAKVRGGRLANGNAAPTAWRVPYGINDVTVTIATPGVFTWTNSNLVAGDCMMLTTTGALPTGLSANTYYFVINPTASTFQLSATTGGAAINTTGSQSGTHTARLYALPKDKPGYSSPATDGRFSTAFGGLINAQINIGHRAGGVCISDTITDWEIDGTEIFNCATAVGAIDSMYNSRGSLRNLYVNQCGYSDTTAKQGAFGFGGNTSLGWPKEMIMDGCRIFDSYPTVIGGASASTAVQGRYPTVTISNCFWHNTPVTYQYVRITHDTTQYTEPLGTTTFNGDVLVAFLGDVRGTFDMEGLGGDITVSASGASGTFDLDFSGTLGDSYDTQMKLFGSSDIPGFRIRRLSIVQSNTVNTFTASSWSGIQAASAGGYAKKVNIMGPLDIRVANTSLTGLAGIRCTNSTAGDISAGNVFANCRIKMGVSTQKAIAYETGSTNLMTDSWVINPQTYPELDITGWSSTINIVGDTVLLPV